MVLLSRDEAYAIRALVTVASVTTRMRGIPAEVALGPEDGLPRVCAANLDTITTVSQAALLDRITALTADKRKAIDRAIHFALGLEDL